MCVLVFFFSKSKGVLCETSPSLPLRVVLGFGFTSHEEEDDNMGFFVFIVGLLYNCFNFLIRTNL
jgi:hypothetical protein